MNTAQKPIEASGNARFHRRPLREWAINITAALFWAFYAAVFLQKAWITRDFMSLGLWLYYSLVVWLFITRAPAKRSAPWPVTLVALCSMALPVVGLSQAPRGHLLPGILVQGVALVGMFIATASLGRSFAIAPADRGLRTTGPYRWVRHPLYASELLFYVGYLLANWSWRNALILGVAVMLILFRIYHEERLITGYDRYTHQVRWRLIPWVW